MGSSRPQEAHICQTKDFETSDVGCYALDFLDLLILAKTHGKRSL